MNYSVLKQMKSVIGTLKKPYLPPEYEERWGSPLEGPIGSWVSDLRRARDRRHFSQLVRDSDVFLVGHPKSGNTWCAYMLGILLNHDFDCRINLANIGEAVPVIHGKDCEIERYAHLPEPRVFRNEWPVYPDLYPRVIYLIRDPRAALVSYYHMYVTITGDTSTTITAFVSEYLAKGCVLRLEPNIRWDVQVKSWLRRARTDSSVLVMTYESMLADRYGTLEKLCRFLGLEVEERLMDLVVNRGGFTSMQQDEQAHGAESYLGLKERRSSFIRKGKADGWREELPPAAIREIEAVMGETMVRMGYEPA